MSKPARLTKPDPIFAAIDAHRLATATRYPIQEKMGETRDGTTMHTALWIAHDKAMSVMAVTAYFVEHTDHYPGCGWIGSESEYDDPSWFGDGLMRSLAAALAKISS